MLREPTDAAQLGVDVGQPALAATVDAMQRALVSALVDPGQITAVLLVGGSSRIPLVAELVSDAFGRPVAVDADPKHAVALGAAHAAADEAQALATPDVGDAAVRLAPAGAVAATTPDHPPTGQLAVPLEAQKGRQQHHDAPAAHGTELVEELPPLVLGDQRRWSRKSLMQAAAVIVLALIGVGAGAFYSPDDSDGASRVGASAAELVRRGAVEPIRVRGLGRRWDGPGKTADDTGEGVDNAAHPDGPDEAGPDTDPVTPAKDESGSGRASGSSGGSSSPRKPPSSRGRRDD